MSLPGLRARSGEALRRARGRLPQPVRRLAVALVVAGLVAGAFAGVVLPLFHFGNPGPPVAEIAGLIPESIPAGRGTDMEVAIDNTGDASIGPICILATFTPPVEVRSVVFQGLDRVAFHEGRACGGKLNAQETISVRLSLLARSPGPVHVTLRPGSGSRAIGPAIAGNMQVR